MKINMGSVDRIVRIVIAIVFSTLYFTGTVTGVAGVILLILGGIFILTSVVGFCPLYGLFGIKTCKTKN